MEILDYRTKQPKQKTLHSCRIFFYLHCTHVNGIIGSEILHRYRKCLKRSNRITNKIPEPLTQYSPSLYPTPDSGFNSLYIYPALTARTTALLSLHSLLIIPTSTSVISLYLLIILLWFSFSSSLLLPEAYNEDQQLYKTYNTQTTFLFVPK